MATINTANLTPMQLGRLNAALDKLARYDGEVRTLRAHIATLGGDKQEWSGMCDWSRSRFNAMNAKEQRAYEERLKARRYYTVDGWRVPKIVYDAVVGRA